MDALRQLLARINSQLGVLNRSQQLVIGLCAVVIAGSLIWLMQWSSTPDYVPLLPNQSMSMEEITRAAASLQASGADYRVGKDGILVREDARYALMSQLNQADALPQRLDISFATLMRDESPFRPESENEARRNWALGSELAKVIAASPDVAGATVIVNPVTKRVIGGPKAPASASVSITMKSGKSLSDERVRGIARLVSGAVSGLEPHMVAVVDGATGRPWRVPGPEEDDGYGLLEERKRTENHIQAKIIEQLSYIPGVLVAVSAELEADQTEQVTTTYDKPEIAEESSISTDSSSVSTVGEPGTSANVGVALPTSTPGLRETTDETKTRYQDLKPKDLVRTRKARFTPKRLTAAINVPRSFLVGVFKATQGEDKEPAEPDLEELKKLERSRIEGLVQNVLMTKNTQDVQVDFYYDRGMSGSGFPTTEPALAALGGTDETGLWADIQNYLPQAGLALLALFGMVIMMQMVRKTTVAAASLKGPVSDAREDGEGDGDAVLSVGGGPVGMAEVSDGYLTGHEIDESTLRESELRRQVSKLVSDDPHNAADLIRRWVEQPD